MTRLYFEEMMKGLGFHTVGDVAVGFSKEWPCSVERSAEQLSLRIVMEKEAKNCVKELQAKALEHISWRIEKDMEQTGFLVLTADMTPPSDFYSKATLHTALSAANACLSKAGFVPPKTCLLCGGNACDAWAYLKEECRPVHLICLDTKLDLPEEDTKFMPKTSGYYWSGFLGALLGAAVAALPNWAQALSEASINQLLYLFLPFMASLLYRLFRGKANLLAAGVSVLLACLFVAFGLELIWFWVVATAQAGYNITLAETTTLYFEVYSLQATFRDMLPSLLFLIAGFFPSSILLRRYVNSHTVQAKTERGSRFVKKSAFLLQDDQLMPRETDIEEDAESTK